MLSDSFFLRPTFTKAIIQQLQRGRSINLIGKEGSGRRRLLEDIQKSGLLETTVVLINLKNYRLSYEGFMRDFCSQLEKDNYKADTLNGIIEKYEENKERIFIFLHNFDALLNNQSVDGKYDTCFYDNLNYIKNKSNIALICVTEKPHDQSLVFIAGKPHRNSWLDLEKKHIPKLTNEEITLELERQSLSKPILKNESVAIAKMVTHQKDKQVEFLRYLTDEIIYAGDSKMNLQKQLKKWRKRFNTLDSSYLSPADIDRAKEKIAFWRNLLGLDSENKVKNQWGLVLRIIIGFLTILGLIGVGNPTTLQPFIDVIKTWIP